MQDEPVDAEGGCSSSLVRESIRETICFASVSCCLINSICPKCLFCIVMSILIVVSRYSAGNFCFSHGIEII